MKTIELIGDVDSDHCLRAQVPPDLPEGPVRVLVLVEEPDLSEEVWIRAIGAEWSEELSDPRQDLYTLDDGKPFDGSR